MGPAPRCWPASICALRRAASTSSPGRRARARPRCSSCSISPSADPRADAAVRRGCRRGTARCAAGLSPAHRRGVPGLPSGPPLSAFDNVALPLRIAGHDEREIEGPVREMLAWVGLADRASARPPTLSGGEQQRVAIARAVIARPELLVADEPTGNVDAAMANRLIHLFESAQPARHHGGRRDPRPVADRRGKRRADDAARERAAVRPHRRTAQSAHPPARRWAAMKGALFPPASMRRLCPSRSGARRRGSSG